jgi:hypothetical protein
MPQTQVRLRLPALRSGVLPGASSSATSLALAELPLAVIAGLLRAVAGIKEGFNNPESVPPKPKRYVMQLSKRVPEEPLVYSGRFDDRRRQLDDSIH